MLLYIQLFTFEQTPEALNLLHFPTYPLLPETFKIKSTRWAMGCNKASSTQDINKIIEAADQKKANEIKINYSFEPYILPETSIKVHKLYKVLTLSPCNCVWSTTNTYEAHTIHHERIRGTFESKQIYVKRQNLVYPTLLETIIKFDSPSSEEENYESFWSILSQSFPQDLLKLKVFGCADIGKADYVSFFDILSNVSCYKINYAILYNKLDRLHPILINSSGLCSQIKKIFPRLTKLKLIESSDGQNQLEILNFSPKSIEKPRTQKLIQPYLVSKESTDPKRLELAPGEFIIGDAKITIYTLKRWETLKANGLTLYLPEDMQIFTVILPKYCRMIDINPKEMIIELMDVSMRAKVEAEIDKNFNELSTTMNLRQRIYLAHEQAYMKLGNGSGLDFVKTMFFPEL